MSVLGGVLIYTPSWIFQPFGPAGFCKCQPARSLPLNRETQFRSLVWADWSNVIEAQVSATTIRIQVFTVITFRVWGCRKSLKARHCNQKYLSATFGANLSSAKRQSVLA